MTLGEAPIPTIPTPIEPPVLLRRLPLEKPQTAVDFLLRHGEGSMDIIAHFWERLAQTPPLARGDLHLVVAGRGDLDSSEHWSGAMLYVPKAHRCDVLAMDPAAAAAFVGYIGKLSGSERPAIDFLTGKASGIEAMVPPLLQLLHKRQVARRRVNRMMILPESFPATRSGSVRNARDGDAAVLTRWRRLYREERGIAFDMDVDAWVESKRVFVFEEGGQIKALAKFDLVLTRLIEIGGVYTFPEFRKNGIGRELMLDLAARIRQSGRRPTLQVDQENEAAVGLYQQLGWQTTGKLARIWLHRPTAK